MQKVECPRPKCWYYNEITHRFSDDGVATNVVNGTVYCLAHHLSGFTLRTGEFLHVDLYSMI